MLKSCVSFLFVLLFSSALVAQSVERREYVKQVDGGVTTETLDGYTRVSYGNGDVVVLSPDGAKTVYLADGSAPTTTPDGHDVVGLPTDYAGLDALDGPGAVDFKKLSMEAPDGTTAVVETTTTTKFPVAPALVIVKTNWWPVVIIGTVATAVIVGTIVACTQGDETVKATNSVRVQ